MHRSGVVSHVYAAGRGQIGGPARGIVTEGLRYPLHDEELAPGTSRGVSNELAVGIASVRLAAGTLLVVQPFGGTQ